ncbi:MAG: hypothetical protein H0V66_00685 [Bdellovibrionales bacterium]|nr:hypothetical protein [Bdellovibrionales bacterium]
MKALLLTILLACSCSKKTPLTKDAMGLRLTDVQMNITHLNEIEWLVGKQKEAKVTQSIIMIVDMPKVAEDDLDHLFDLKGIDSWILRLIVQRGSERQDLGSLYTRFKAKKVSRGQGGGAPTSVTIKIYYAAAYPSERFRFFHCPAFGHSKRISNMRIAGEEDQTFDLPIEQMTSYPEKSHLVELAPSSFNGGNSLVGEYFVEIAPYNSEKKVIYSAFKRIPMYVEVTSEKEQSVKSCLGVHEEIQ